MQTRRVDACTTGSVNDADPTRPRAMGRSGIRVDCDIGLDILLRSVGFTTICLTFHTDLPAGLSAAQWVHEEAHTPFQTKPCAHCMIDTLYFLTLQVLRCVFRWGLLDRAFSVTVARWPMCYFGYALHSLFPTVL